MTQSGIGLMAPHWVDKVDKSFSSFLATVSSSQCLDMIVGKIENGLERGFVKHRLLITIF